MVALIAEARCADFSLIQRIMHFLPRSICAKTLQSINFLYVQNHTSRKAMFCRQNQLSYRAGRDCEIQASSMSKGKRYAFFNVVRDCISIDFKD